MVSAKSLLIATLVSSVIATPLNALNSTNVNLEIVDKVPVVESREKASYFPAVPNDGYGGGGGGDGANCNYAEKTRLDQEIQNRYQLKDRLDSEIKRREAMKDQLDEQIRRKQGGYN
ncbi:EC8 protein [Colletotrichum tofieldiae]|uniref:Ec8 protein n=1 Tax=Colletotrichum tofieldiae TaxID=708197 RepID=A0A166PWQ6_9PEZI|nr:ec8 protein [Colletotrichum tofieldiae]GKT58164.1 EC8 protein [Colletotrichum tofieldiae]GKT79667.1 EC8 protein [Colletotrichum tofieldiae]GKT84239.1 EC8 protein [Colletotrichum tofieldiae]